MSVPRVELAGAAVGTYAYAIGGADGTDAVLASVEFAEVDADGTLGLWALTAPLATPRFAAEAVGIGDKLYVVGGWSAIGCCGSTVHYGSTEIGRVNGNGTVASWEPGTELLDGIGNGKLTTDGLRLYYAGGFGDTGSSAAVQMADVQSDGSLSPWRATTPLPAPREAAAGLVAAGRVYIFGGIATSEVLSAAILSSGDLGAWRAEESLSVVRLSGMAFAGQSMLFVGGGSTPAPSQTFSSFEQAEIGVDGVLSSWTPTESLNVPRSNAAPATVGTTFIVIGGTETGADRRADTETAQCLGCPRMLPAASPGALLVALLLIAATMAATRRGRRLRQAVARTSLPAG